jgi:hypothetical protein
VHGFVFFFFWLRSELPSSARGMNDPIYDVASEEIYQDLCVLRTPHEVHDFLSCLTRIAFHFFFFSVTHRVAFVVVVTIVGF